MYAVTALRYKGPLKTPLDLQKANRVTHECITAESAVQVLRDLVAIAERDVDSADLYGYSVSVAYSPQK